MRSAGILTGLAGLCLLLVATPAAAAPPANDNFEDATPLSSTDRDPIHGSNVDATVEPDEPAPDPYPAAASVWYSTSVEYDSPVRVELCSNDSDFDGVVAVFRGESLSGLTLIAGAEKGCQVEDGARFRAVAGETYWIAVHARGGSTGSFRIDATVSSPVAMVEPTTVYEGDTQPTYAIFAVKLSHPVSREAEVKFVTSSAGSARIWEDYEPTSGNVRFPPGETSGQIAIRVFPDTRFESNEYFFIEISGGYRVRAPSPSLVKADILDNDPPPPNGVNCSMQPPYLCSEPGAGSVRMANSGNGSELLKTIPITRRGKGRVVMRIGPKQLPEVRRGDRIETSAELAVSVTCKEQLRRCVGTRYRYDPLVRGHIVLARKPNAKKGIRVSRIQKMRCTQRRPHRNHHCVLVLAPKRYDLPPKGCRGCSLNLVLSARHKQAKRGNKLVIGSDANSGIAQDRGRLNAILISPDAPRPTRLTERKPSRGALKVAKRRARPPQRVIYSIRLDDLEKHEQIAIDARALVRIDHLPYSTFVGSQLVLADGPRETRRGLLAKRVAIESSEVSEKNGFNCTSGRSAHRSPCRIRSVGHFRLRRSISAPLYVNLVVQLGARWGGTWHQGHRGRVLKRGAIRAMRYEPGAWIRVTEQK